MQRVTGLAQFGHRLFDLFNAGLALLGWWLDRLMLHPPDRFQGGRVGREAGDEMPVDMGELIAQELVVDLPGIENLCQCLGHQGDFFHQLHSLRGGQLEEFGGVAPEDDDGPALEKLILMQVGLGKSQVGDEMVGARPGTLAGATGIIGHG